MRVSAVVLLGCALTCPARAQVVFAPPELVHPASPDSLFGSCLAADFNGDGAFDVAVLDAAFVFDVTTLLGNGHGAFTSLPAQSLSPTNFLFAATDVDNDGDLDLLAQGTSDAPTALLVLRGHGDGSFDAPLGSGVSTSPMSLVAADVDQDGVQDFVAVTTAGFFPKVGFWRGAGGGSFLLKQVLQPDAIFTASVQLADFDSDSWLDVALAGPSAGVELFAGDATGAGTFVTTPSTVLSTTSFNAGLIVDDLDADGRADLLTTETDAVDVSLGLGNGSFAPVVATPLPGVGILRTGDWDGDGVRDLGASAAAPLELAFLRSVGGGHFAPLVPLSTHGPLGLYSVADFDGDARDDGVGYRNTTSGAGAGAWLLPNATYTAHEPFVDLGGALPGTAGWPILLCSGALHAGRPFAFKLASAAPGSAPFLIVGASPSGQTFAGGTLWPTPDRIVSMPVAGTDGVSIMAGTWPPGLVGVQLWIQVWFEDSGAAQGWAATSGVMATGH